MLPQEVLAAKEERARVPQEKARRGRSGSSARPKEPKKSEPVGRLAWTACDVVDIPEVSFRMYCDDYFRDLSAADIAALLPPQGGSAGADAPFFRIPATGRPYEERWKDEDAAEAARLAKIRSEQAAASRRKRAIAAMNRDSGGVPGVPEIVTVISPNNDAEADVCHVCCDGTSVEGNRIIYCEQCNVPVHQICYGVNEVPDGPWLCTPCSQGVVGAKCMLCTVPGGALKPVRNMGGSIPSQVGVPPAGPAGGAQSNAVGASGQGNAELGAAGASFAHLFCSQWVPETFVVDTEKMSPIEGVHQIRRDRLRLVCGVCNQKTGACIQCAHGNCVAAFHPTCARASKWRMEIRSKGGSIDELELKAYCGKHSKLRAENDAKISAAMGTARAGVSLTNGCAPSSANAGKQTSGTDCPEGEPANYLDTCQPSEVASLLRQTLPLRGMTLGQVATKMGTQQRELSSWLTNPIQNAIITAAAREWLRVGPRATGRPAAPARAVAPAPSVPPPSNSAAPTRELQAAKQAVPAAKAASGKAATLPAKIPEPPERLHPLTAKLLATTDSLPAPIVLGSEAAERIAARHAELVASDTESKANLGRCAVCVVQRKGRCGTDTAPAKCLKRAPVAEKKPGTPSAPPPPAAASAPAGKKGNLDGLGAFVPSLLPPGDALLPSLEATKALLGCDECQRLLATAPEDEVTGELILAQHELIMQRRANEKIFAVVLERAMDDIDAQAKERAKRLARNTDVEALAESLKEAKRLQRKEIRDRSREEAKRSAANLATSIIEDRPRVRDRDTRKRERKDELSEEMSAAIVHAGACLQRVRDMRRDCEQLRTIVERVARRERVKREIVATELQIQEAKKAANGTPKSAKRSRH